MRLMTNFNQNLIKVIGLISDGILSGRKIVKIKWALKDSIERLILILINIFYIFHSQSNLISLNLLDDIKIFNNNKNQILSN